MPREQLFLEWPENISLQVSPEAFAHLARVNQELRLERTAQGELIVNPPTGGESGRRNFRLTGQLARWCEEYPELGEGFDSSTGFLLPNGANRSPDAAWIRRERWEALQEEEKKGFVPLCPDFVWELRSETDSLPKLQAKMREYLANGTRLGWLIDPFSQRVEIYRPEQEVEVLVKPMELSGEEVLPGLRLHLERIWP